MPPHPRPRQALANRGWRPPALAPWPDPDLPTTLAAGIGARALYLRRDAAIWERWERAQ